MIISTIKVKIIIGFFNVVLLGDQIFMGKHEYLLAILVSLVLFEFLKNFRMNMLYNN